MSLLPDILSIQRESGAVVLELLVSEQLAFFRGHFPGLPILPGVVQIDWAMRYASQELGVPVSRFSGMKALKFTAPVRPGLRLTLDLRFRPEAQRLEFSYFSATKKYSSGQILLSGDAL